MEGAILSLLHSQTLKKCKNESNEQLIEEIENVKSKLKFAEDHFSQITDDDLIEATAYEIKSLNAKYRYLLKEAKRSGATKNISAVIKEADYLKN